MAESDKIKSKDIIQDDIFKNTIDSAEDLIKVLDELKKEFVGVAESQAKVAKNQAKNLNTADDIAKTTQAITESSKAREQANKISQEKVKLEQKLKIANSSAIDQNTQLKIQLAEQNKVNKEFAKEKLGLISSYDKETKRLIKLRKQYKDLASQNKDNTKQSGKLLKEIRDLDKKLKDIDASVGQFQRSVGDYGKEALGSTKATLGLALAIVGLNGELGDLKTGLQVNEEGSKELQSLTDQSSAVFNTFANRVAKAGSGLIDLIKIYTNINSNNVSITNSFNKVGDATSGVVEALSKSAAAAKKASEAQFELDRSSLALREQLTALNGEFERQSAIAGDSTRSFNEQQAAAEDAERVNIRRIAIQRDLAAQELEIIETRLSGNEKDRNDLALQLEATEKRIALKELQNELDLATIDNEKVLREIQRDRFERELDFAIDAFDAQKTINERQIADDRKSIEERQAIFDETERLTESSFQSQKDLFAEFVNDKVDFDVLAAETDEAQIRRTLRGLDLDDIELGRALEVIRERKIALQDLDDSERDIADARKERLDTQLNSINELEQLQIQAEIDRIRNLENQTKETTEGAFELEKRALEDEADFRIQTEVLTAEEIEVIRQELANNIVSIEQQKADDLLAIQKQQLEDERAITDAKIQTAQSLSEISKIIAGEDEKAQRAVLATQKAIAVAEILVNLQRETSDIRVKNAGKEEGSALNTAQITEARVTALAGVATVLTQSFFDGTENTGNGGKVDDRGGFNAILHPFERVMDAKNNAKVGELSNNDLADVAMMYNKGHLVNPFTDMSFDVNSNEKKTDKTHLIVSQLQKLEDSINNKPVQQVNVDSFGNLVEVVYKNGVKDTYKYQAKKWL